MLHSHIYMPPQWRAACVSSISKDNHGAKSKNDGFSRKSEFAITPGNMTRLARIQMDDIAASREEKAASRIAREEDAFPTLIIAVIFTILSTVAAMALAPPRRHIFHDDLAARKCALFRSSILPSSKNITAKGSQAKNPEPALTGARPPAIEGRCFAKPKRQLANLKEMLDAKITHHNHCQPLQCQALPTNE